MNIDDRNDLTWLIIFGRRAAHACIEREGLLFGICGQTRRYPMRQMTTAPSGTLRCVECQIVLAGGSPAALSKFFGGRGPRGSDRAKRRRLWRAWREEHGVSVP